MAAIRYMYVILDFRAGAVITKREKHHKKHTQA